MIKSGTANDLKLFFLKRLEHNPPRKTSFQIFINLLSKFILSDKSCTFTLDVLVSDKSLIAS